MDQLYKNFYRQLYLKTGGFIPTKPLNGHLFPGDYFQIKNGEILVAGNVYRDAVISAQDVELSAVIALNASGWNFSDGVSKPYSGRGMGNGSVEGAFEFSKQILKFANRGSFCFRAEEPRSLRINNWNAIQQQLIIKLTHALFSFRELYVVTESATATSTTLAIAGEPDAELELATDQENFGLAAIFGLPSVKTVQSKDIAYYERETTRKPAYFKAKKLVIREEKYPTGNSIDTASTHSAWTAQFFDAVFDDATAHSSAAIRQHAPGSSIDKLPSNELTAKTALSYFEWADANLDDVEKLFNLM